MRLFKIFRWKRKPGGRIASLGLGEWYSSLTNEEQEKLKKYASMGISVGLGNLDSGTITSSSTDQQQFLSTIGSNAVSHKDFSFAEKVLIKALDSKGDNIMDRHFTYNSLIKLYYKKRDELEDALDKCIYYCLRDIDIADDFLQAWHEEYGDEVPRIPSFKRLAIIYEKQGKFKNAINICDMALERELADGTKSGFKGRRKRLEKKLDNRE